jgi:hypothetical protein
MIRALLMAGVLVVAITAGAWGQSLAAARADVPFDFVVDGKIMKAGTYKFQTTTFMGVLVLAEHNGRLMTYLPGVPVGNPNARTNPRIVFLKQGGTYTLNQIWMHGIGAGHQLATPKADPGHVHVAVNLSR